MKIACPEVSDNLKLETIAFYGPYKCVPMIKETDTLEILFIKMSSNDTITWNRL